MDEIVLAHRGAQVPEDFRNILRKMWPCIMLHYRGSKRLGGNPARQHVRPQKAPRRSPEGFWSIFRKSAFQQCGCKGVSANRHIYVHTYTHHDMTHVCTDTPPWSETRWRRERQNPKVVKNREFTKGGLVKGGLAIYAFPLCNCNALGSVFNVQIENMPNC